MIFKGNIGNNFRMNRNLNQNCKKSTKNKAMRTKKNVLLALSIVLSASACETEFQIT